MPRHVYPSLHRALLDFGIPFENRALIDEMCSWIGIASYVKYADHIRAIRVDSDKPALWIRMAYTEGFVDQDEARDASGGRAPYARGFGLKSGSFYVEHPVNRLA